MKFIMILFLSIFLYTACSGQSQRRGDDSSNQHLTELLTVVDNLSEYDGTATLEVASNGELRVISFNDGYPSGSNLTEEVCNQSGNIKFAKCVGNWLAEHPGKCLTVWHDANGNHADDECTIPN